ncbi:hypothetical protein ACJJTC_014469 [Scirpophaga incertulas]
MTTATEDLQSEVDFYRQNQAVVEEEVKKLIADNQKLSQQVGNLLREKIQNAQPHPINTNHQKEEELKTQILLLTKERDSLHVLWQTSQRTINALETELKIYGNYNGHEQQNLNENTRELTLKLDTALQDYLDLESKYKDLDTKYNSIMNELKYKEKEIVSYKERGKLLEDQLKEAIANLNEFKINMASEKKICDDLKTQLKLCQKEKTDLTKREIEAKTKVAEALQLFDLVMKQKNDAHKNITKLSGELQTMKIQVANIRNNIESQYKTELDEVREKYNEKVADMLQHIKNLDEELVEKGLLLNKAVRELKILKTTNEEYLKQHKDKLRSVDPKIALYEQRLETMFQELVASERRNIQLACEKQCLAIDLQRNQDIHSREIKRRNWEENLLKTQCEDLKLQIEHLQKSLEETHSMISKLQTMMSSRTELNQKMISKKEQELLELNKHFQNQIQLNKKWKDSYVDMTEKLKKKLLDMQKENDDLRSKLKSILNDTELDTNSLN